MPIPNRAMKTAQAKPRIVSALLAAIVRLTLRSAMAKPGWASANAESLVEATSQQDTLG